MADKSLKRELDILVPFIFPPCLKACQRGYSVPLRSVMIQVRPVSKKKVTIFATQIPETSPCLSHSKMLPFSLGGLYILKYSEQRDYIAFSYNISFSKSRILPHDNTGFRIPTGSKSLEKTLHTKQQNRGLDRCGFTYFLLISYMD